MKIKLLVVDDDDDVEDDDDDDDVEDDDDVNLPVVVLLSIKTESYLFLQHRSEKTGVISKEEA